MLSYAISLVLSQWALLAAAAIYFVYRKITAPFTFFADRGIAFVKPYPIFGNFGRMSLKRESIFDLVVNNYNDFKGKRFVCLCPFEMSMLNSMLFAFAQIFWAVRLQSATAHDPRSRTHSPDFRQGL